MLLLVFLFRSKSIHRVNFIFAHSMYTFIYKTHIYIYIYIYACMHACMHTYTHTYIHTYRHTYLLTYLHTYTYACMHTYLDTYLSPMTIYAALCLWMLRNCMLMCTSTYTNYSEGNQLVLARGHCRRSEHLLDEERSATDRSCAGGNRDPSPSL